MKRLMLCLVVLSGIAYSMMWWSGRPAMYKLTIINASNIVVDSVAFVGSGVSSPAGIALLRPGDTDYLEAEVQRQGELRIQISQSGYQIDSLIKKTSAPLDAEQQRLTIHAGNRYIFSQDSQQR